MYDIADDANKAVRQEAAKAVDRLVQMQKRPGQPLHVLALACLSAEECLMGGLGLAHWQCLVHLAQHGPMESQHIDVVLGLEQVQSLTSAFLFRETDEDVQVIC